VGQNGEVFLGDSGGRGIREQGQGPQGRDERAGRLAEALRRNLRRRKDQARERGLGNDRESADRERDAPESDVKT